jgi:hypothetical protein
MEDVVYCNHTRMTDPSAVRATQSRCALIAGVRILWTVFAGPELGF